MTVLGDQPIQPVEYGIEQLDGMSIHVDLRFLCARGLRRGCRVRALRSEAASGSLALHAIAFRNLPGTATSPWPCARRRGAQPCCYDQGLPGRIVSDTHKPSLVPPMRSGKNATKRPRGIVHGMHNADVGGV